MNVPPPFPTGRPYVTFAFDGGTVDHLNVSTLFAQYGMSATFFVNTATIGSSSAYLTRANLTSMQQSGHEIGSGEVLFLQKKNYIIF